MLHHLGLEDSVPRNTLESVNVFGIPPRYFWSMVLIRYWRNCGNISGLFYLSWSCLHWKSLSCTRMTCLKEAVCSSLSEVPAIWKASSESPSIGSTWTMNIWSKKGSLWDKITVQSAERSSSGNSQEGTKPIPCRGVQALSTTGNLYEAKTLKGMTTMVAFSCCFMRILNMSARESLVTCTVPINHPSSIVTDL